MRDDVEARDTSRRRLSHRKRFLQRVLASLVLPLAALWVAAAQPAVPRPDDHAARAISIVRVTMDGGFRGMPQGVGYRRLTGTVWIANDTALTLQDVTITVSFYNRHWDAREGSVDYRIGELGPKATSSVNYRWEATTGDPTRPRVRVTWRATKNGTLYAVETSDYEPR